MVAVAVVAVVVLGAGVAWATQRGKASSTKYLTATVARGTVEQTIAATGTVQPGATLSLSFGGSSASSSSQAQSNGQNSSSGTGSSAARECHQWRDNGDLGDRKRWPAGEGGGDARALGRHRRAGAAFERAGAAFERAGTSGGRARRHDGGNGCLGRGGSGPGGAAGTERAGSREHDGAHGAGGWDHHRGQPRAKGCLRSHRR